MAIYCYALCPLEFIIESDCDTPEKALNEALQLGTANEIGLLKYLHNNIEDYPTLNDSVEYIGTSED